MNMNLSQDQLRAFFEVARVGSFTKAADHLGLTQSALSHRIRNLEETLQTALFIRAPGSVKVTEAGRKLLQYCRTQSQLENDFIEDLKSPRPGEMNGFLRIGGASTVMWSAITPAIAPLIKKNPAIQVELMARELSELSALLLSATVDMIVTCGRLENHAFEEVYLGDEQNVLIESRKTTSRNHVYLDHDSADHTTLNYLKFQGEKIKEIRRSYMDNIHGILAGVENGLGRAVVPRHLLEGRKNIQIVEGRKDFKQGVYLYYFRQPFYSKLHLAVIEELQKNVPGYLHCVD